MSANSKCHFKIAAVAARAGELMGVPSSLSNSAVTRWISGGVHLRREKIRITLPAVQLGSGWMVRDEDLVTFCRALQGDAAAVRELAADATPGEARP